MANEGVVERIRKFLDYEYCVLEKKKKSNPLLDRDYAMIRFFKVLKNDDYKHYRDCIGIMVADCYEDVLCAGC